MNQDLFPHRPTKQNCSKRQKEQQRIDAEISAVLRDFGQRSECRVAFEQLLIYVRAYSDLLKPAPGQGSPGWVAPVFLINRLRNLAAHRAHWLRPLDHWHPPRPSLRPFFRSLAQHLLAFYPMPAFMDSVWDMKPGPKGFRQQTWYIRLGRGASVRELDVPLPLTRRMEHYVRLAPEHYTVGQALRHGEVRGLGGTAELAREVVGGPLGREFEHPEFWRTVLWFFVQHPQMPLEYVNPIVDFIQANKFGGAPILTWQGLATRVPPWPEFSMEGRTLNSLLRLTETWHLELGRKKTDNYFSWRQSRIQGYHFLEKGEESDHEWTIQELIDSDALYAEGRAMHHCVYSYADLCRRGTTTIWSLRLRVKEGEKRMATVEVDPLRRAIVQVRAKCNLRPGGRSIEIVRQWAAQERLRLQANVLC